MLGTDGQIGRYVIRRRLAYGGMGTLYLAHDPVLDRTVVLKLFHADLEGPDARERFVREARAVAALNNPNIVTIYDYGEYSSQPFLVMEYIQGETLAELIRRRPFVHTVVKVRWMEELCAAVGYAHDRGIIHRDIKPANLMIDSYGRIKVLDFGIAQMRGTLVTVATGLVGTPGYTAPEQIRGAAVDRRSDLFSIGVVSYELFAFAEPFAAESTHAMSHRILHEDPTPLEMVQPSLDPELAAVVARALRRDPDQRFPNADAMRDALANVRRRLESAEPETTMSYLPPARDHAAAGAKPAGPAPGLTPSWSGPAQVPGPTPAAGRSSEGSPRTPRRATREALARQREEQVQGWIQLAREHAAAGEKAEARDACAQALKLEPAHAEVLAFLGSLERITTAKGDRPPETSRPAVEVALQPVAAGWAPTPGSNPVGPAISATRHFVARVETPFAPVPLITAGAETNLQRAARRVPGAPAGIWKMVAAAAAAAAIAAAVVFWAMRAPLVGTRVLVIIDASPWANVEAVRAAGGESQTLPAGASTPLALMLAPGSYKVVLVGPPPVSERREVPLQVAAESAPRLFEPFAPMTVDRYFAAAVPAGGSEAAASAGRRK
jgi:predicted Ser/Thr protein kinase